MSDRKLLKGEEISYKNEKNFLILNPILHVVTKDGFIIDEEIQIENEKSQT